MSKNVEKLRKKAIQEQQKRLKPGECQKYVRLVLDFTVDEAVRRELDRSELKYEIRGLPERNSIIWERSVGQRLLSKDGDFEENDDAGRGLLADEWQEENQVVRLLSSTELEGALRKKSLERVGSHLRNVFPGKRCSLIVPRLGERNASGDPLTAFIRLQVLQEITVWQVASSSTPQEEVNLLQMFTKSIAETPFKREKEKHLGAFKNFLANDNKQCVRVEGSVSLGRLWQQHLTRLPLVTLEVAETIIAKHSCPKKLLDDFEKNPLAVEELADCKIRRGGGGLSSQFQDSADRRIGQVLSGKLLTLYTARDPNTLI